MKKFLLALSAASLIAGASAPAMASPCKDKKGRFVKCSAKPKLCRDAKGHFIKCPKKK